MKFRIWMDAWMNTKRMVFPIESHHQQAHTCVSLPSCSLEVCLRVPLACSPLGTRVSVSHDESSSSFWWDVSLPRWDTFISIHYGWMCLFVGCSPCVLVKEEAVLARVHVALNFKILITLDRWRLLFCFI